jgi:outer membrane beta-barrel protein
MGGYVPNNPFARRFVGSVQLAYHFSETLAAAGVLSYSPDLGEADLKGLTRTLVRIAHVGGQVTGNFEQPLDKVTLAANFGVVWAPLYGKINLVGETVLNFDFYGTLGLALLSKINYYAEYNDAGASTGDFVNLRKEGNEFEVAPTIGAGFNFFLTQAIALKIDARSSFFVDQRPDYEPDIESPTDGDLRLFNHFVASAGVAFFFPKMKPRLYDF